ncbi:RICIN domain-containing protein [Kitasatospora sp. SUK 42]|uniref:RICIN domain-containing protein n=1 Tax=Kitasatospora sp. SUK 42 TaxID=1588882 RepID=UPI001C31A2D5|nr:RICIN domain-containing protein [Kitasatospora sp. SUK 42]MBV2155620.1 RICIN domain-containing protein [Kitasatospora sp. SUK 42]
MPKTGKIALAVATACFLTGAITATAPTASAQPTEFTDKVRPVLYDGYLSPAPDGTVIVGDAHEWVFSETPSRTFTIRSSNLPGAPCLTAEGDGQPVRVDACRPGAEGQTWDLRESRQIHALLIESVDLPNEVLEAHGAGLVVTLEPKTDNLDQRWHLL